jgi:hypothetical protein
MAISLPMKICIDLEIAIQHIISSIILICGSGTACCELDLI